MINRIKIAIIGLGYVGLPLAVGFSRKFKVIGYDYNVARVQLLKKGIDSNDTKKKNFLLNNNLFFTNNHNEISKCNVFIITVPTPVYKNNLPDLRNLISAINTVAKYLKFADTVILESTVYPGFTDEVLIPILEKKTKFKINMDFYAGYSPERINPGDNMKNLESIVKITSGSNQKSSQFIDKLYRTIVTAGTFKVSSIKIAEAAKVIENTQRDLNIAYVNELTIIFRKMNLNVNKILQAAGTKWNFLNFRPGLVGGHCISVDPFYLTYQSKKYGYNPKFILSGRSINEYMPTYIYKEIKKILSYKKFNNPRILFCGLTFKENVSDIRNSKSLTLLKYLKKLSNKIECYDPHVNHNDFLQKDKINIIKEPKKNYYDLIIITVSHDYFKELGINFFKKSAKKNHLIFDVKSIFKSEDQNYITL
jgi:UDP-N-acetyl-D-glucosamine/UDP-N-acetyl-D-galactosamine dehydrogenase